MVFGKKKADAARGTAKTLAPIPGKAFGVSGKQKKATGTTVPGKASVSETDSQDGKKKNRLLTISPTTDFSNEDVSALWQ